MEAIKTKSISDFLNEDSCLTEKISYEEFTQKKNAPRNDDHPIGGVIEGLEEFLRIIGQDK